MAWVILVISGAMEAVWATALGKSEGFTKLGPSIVFVVGCAFSMIGLATAMKSLPVGTAYAVWVGIGGASGIGVATGPGSSARSGGASSPTDSAERSVPLSAGSASLSGESAGSAASVASSGS